MSIFPLPQFEADLLEADREVYDRLKPPTSIVVRFGAMKMVGEFPYDGDAKPGCGSKLVVRSHRGTEVGEMLTSTCPNAGCSKSVTRQEMLEYIENSGGRDYPFFTEGRVLRVATVEDLNRQSALDRTKPDLVKRARQLVQEHNLDMKVVDAEPILGGETLTFFFTSEHRVDFRDLVRSLAREFHARIELRQVGARDEARLVADYERCGQHCCCKQFLKVLKPVSMKSAKVQKATLDPLKISGRCGRLMCCLRYEDETYDSLKKNLPKRGARVGTPEGPGVVVDAQILTQLVLVELEPPEGAGQEFERKQVAVPVEELMDPDAAPKRAAPARPDPFRGMMKPLALREREDRAKDAQQDAYRERAKREDRDAPPGPDTVDDIMASLDGEDAAQATPSSDAPASPERKRRRKRKGKKPDGAGGSGEGADQARREQPRPPREGGRSGGGSAGPGGPGGGGSADGSGERRSSRSSRNRRGRGGRGDRGDRGRGR